MDWRRPPIWLLRPLFPGIIWKKKHSDKRIIYLTFDDGPSTLTEDISRLLDDRGHHATFFLLGEGVKKYPEVIPRLQSAGHAIGLHGHQHLDAWKSDAGEFINDYRKGNTLITSGLYRPPYGHLRLSQFRQFRQEKKIVMWNIMPGDFLDSMNAEAVSRYILDHVRPGSIIVLHDQERLREKLMKALPMIMDGIEKKGLLSEAL